MAQPKLRFKREDGTNYPDWNKKKIGDLAKIFSAARVHRDEWQTEGVPFWRSSDVMAFHQHKVNPMGKAYITLELYEKLSSKSGKMQKGDILITGGGSIGVPYLIQDDCSLYVKDADLLCIQKSVNHNSGFLYQFFWSPTFRSYLGLISHKGTIAHYTITQISETPVAIPCLEEQKKIADFLSTVDEVIAQSEVEVKNFEQQKKATMQKIFSQEVKFKREDGTEFPKWEERTIKDCLNYEQPTNYIVHSENYSNDFDIPVLTANKGFVLGYTDEQDGLYDKGDVIIYDDFTMDMKFVRFKFKVKSSAMKMLTAKTGINLYFIYSLLCSLNLHQDVHSRSYISQVEPMIVFIPCLEEQQKIADFLSAFDEAITCAKQELDKWKELKKGLLQQMFV